MPLVRNSNEWKSFPIEQIKPYKRHPRIHNKRQIEKLKRLIRHYGQVVPVVVDRHRVIVDGHAVWTAMRELGSGEIAAVVVANRRDPEIKALRIALNRIPEDAGWDDERLRKELKTLVKLSFDLELTGFETVEIDRLLDVDLPKLNVTKTRRSLRFSSPRSPPPARSGPADATALDAATLAIKASLT